MSGPQVLAALRGEARITALPVINRSNWDDAEPIDPALALGAIDYLIKTSTAPAQLSHGVLRWVATQCARPADVPVPAEAHPVTDGANGSRR
jgi:PleD family two-component response regulator